MKTQTIPFWLVLAPRSDRCVGSACAFRRKGKQRWLVIATAKRNRVCESAFTDNAGRTWKQVKIGNIKNEGPLFGGSLSVVSDNDIWFMTNRKNIYRSRDGGETWQLKENLS